MIDFHERMGPLLGPPNQPVKIPVGMDTKDTKIKAFQYFVHTVFTVSYVHTLCTYIGVNNNRPQYLLPTTKTTVKIKRTTALAPCSLSFLPLQTLIILR